jgi:hypothetical protein
VCREALADSGILLVQDADLRSVTTLVAGAPVRGSWWAHEQAHSIFDVLEELEHDATLAKLVAKKQTLVHRRLWAALAAVGGEGAAWQLDGLPADARTAFDDVLVAGTPVRADTLAISGRRSRADVVRDLERRLLLAVAEVHTESGRHAKVLQSWRAWAAASGATAPRTDPATARATLEAAVAALAPARVPKLLPWPMEVTP